MEVLSPFKFLDSYTKLDKDIFFGRESEVEELYSKVFQGRMLLVYGASGTGKSSIINCGLANKFQDSDWLPVNIRRGDNINQSLLTELEKVQLNPETGKEPSEESIANALSDIYLDQFKPVFLIFDQFEELFIFGQKSEWKKFVSVVHHILANDQNVRFVFIIRGEYLEYLSEFEAEIPEFFDNRLRIEKMTRQKAIECIEGPCELFSIELEENFVDNLLKKLSPDKSEIELTFLQVFLDRIYQNAERRVNGVTKTYFTNKQIDDLGEISDVLAEFLDNQIYESTDPELTLSILKSFVSLEGTKSRNSLDEVVQFTESIGKPVDEQTAENIVHDLVNRRILKDKDESGQYEFRHDSLALKIYEKITQQERELIDVKSFLTHSYIDYEKRGVLLDESDLAYVGLYEKELVLNPDIRRFIEESQRNSKKKKRSRRRFIAILTLILLLLITTLFGFFYSQKQKAKAEEMAILAQDESERAKDLQEQAESQRSIAENNAQEAMRQSELANSARSNAELAREEAERQRSLAIKAQNTAVQEAEMARLARQEAEVNAQEAEKQKAIADSERSIAERLYMLALARTMGIKSTQLDDKEQSALIALQAHSFNTSFDGNAYQPEIYTALFEASQNYLGEDYNAGHFHDGAVRAIVSFKDKIYTTGSDGEVLVWTLADHTLSSRKLASTNLINHRLSVSGDGNTLVTSTDVGQIFFINTSDGKVIHSEQAHEGDVTALSFMQDGTRLASAGEDGVIYLWEGQKKQLVAETEKRINGLAASGEELLVAMANGEIRKYKTDGSYELIHKESIPATSITVDQKANQAAFGFENGKLILWDLIQNKTIANLTGHTASVSDVYFDQKGEFLVSSSFDRSARLWKLDQLQEQPVVLSDHGSWISSVGFSPNDRGVIIGEFNQKIRFYPLDMNEYVDELCPLMGRNLTADEWNEFVAEDVEYKTTCSK